MGCFLENMGFGKTLVIFGEVNAKFTIVVGYNGSIIFLELIVFNF